MDILATLQSLHPDFTKSEKKVADFMLNELDGHALLHATLSHVAEVTGTGQATVIRVVKRCGYDSFRAFMADLSQAKFRLHGANAAAQDASAAYDNILFQLQLCRDSLDRRQLRMAAEVMAKADLIVCTGYGNSSHIAALAASHLRRARLVATQSVPGEIGFHGLRETVALGRPLKTVVLAFSVSGEGDTINKLVERYLLDGACIIGITSHQNSTLAKQSNFVFLTPSNASERQTGRWMDGMINQLYLVEALTEEVYANLYSEEE